MFLLMWFVVRVGACVLCFFFFQAEDGIRDATVTGVQTCALPISTTRAAVKQQVRAGGIAMDQVQASAARVVALRARWPVWAPSLMDLAATPPTLDRKSVV